AVNPGLCGPERGGSGHPAPRLTALCCWGRDQRGRADSKVMPSLLDAARTAGDDADALYDAFLEWTLGRGIELYPAQDEAVMELVQGSNVILATPTGTGKSLVALAAHAIALGRGGRTYYTAPIKALVS